MAQPRTLGGMIAPLARKALGRHRLALAEVALHWRQIVGDALADRCMIDKFMPHHSGRSVGGTLTLRTAPADALEVQHAAGLIAERVNAYLGYQAVGRVRLVHGRVPGVSRPKPPRRISTTEEAEVQAAVARVDEPGLRAALAELGRALYRADQTPAADRAPESDHRSRGDATATRRSTGSDEK